MRARRYSTIHDGGDVQLAQWFRTGLNTFIGGVDVKVAKRTTFSYDQFYAFFKDDTFFHLAPTPFTLVERDACIAGRGRCWRPRHVRNAAQQDGRSDEWRGESVLQRHRSAEQTVARCGRRFRPSSSASVRIIGIALR